jgi:hypothetical protein
LEFQRLTAAAAGAKGLTVAENLAVVTGKAVSSFRAASRRSPSETM